MVIEISFANVTASQADSLPTWTMVELQGKLTGPTNATELAGATLGKVLKRSDGKPMLQLNNTLVGGESKKCHQPLLVLQKVEEVQADGKTRVFYDVKAVVRERLVFTERPQPIVGGGGVKSSLS